MAKLTLNPVANISGAESTAIGTINTNFDAIEIALENTLSRDGTNPNQMNADLDLNNNDILNVDNIHASTLVLDGVTIVPTEVTEVVPISAGGTGATTADGALTSLGGGAAGVAVFKKATAAEIRTSIDVVREIYPEWYGAVGDGTTDDTVAINAAMTAGGAGSTIRFDDKIYCVSSTLALKNGQTFEGISRVGSVFGANDTAGTVIKWIGASAGTVINYGAPNDGATTEYFGGGLKNIQVNCNWLASTGIRCAAVGNPLMDNVKVYRVLATSGQGIFFSANTTFSGLDNAIRNGIFKNLGVYAYQAASGITNLSNGTEGGLTGCIFENIAISHGANTGSGTGIYLSSIDDCAFTGLVVGRSAGGTGVSIYLDGNAAGGKVVTGCEFRMVHVSDGPVLADGAFSRSNFMMINGVDESPTIIRSNGAELYTYFLGSGYSGTPLGEQAYNRTPPLQIVNYTNGDPTTLDWYEEGSWTPALLFGGGGAGQTYTGTRAGRFTRIGNKVTAWGRIEFGTKGSSTGNAQIINLPYASSSNTMGQITVGYYATLSGITGAIGGNVDTSTTTMTLYIGGTTAIANMTHANFNDGSRIDFKIEYEV